MTRYRGVYRGEMFSRIWSVFLKIVALGHRSGSPEAFWSTCLPLTPVFWDANIRVTNYAVWRLDSVVVA